MIPFENLHSNLIAEDWTMRALCYNWVTFVNIFLSTQDFPPLFESIVSILLVVSLKHHKGHLVGHACLLKRQERHFRLSDSILHVGIA